MIVLGWHVDGFGALRDVGVRDLGPGLTVVTGPNEAGKSTLLAFLRFMLFGFAGERTHHRPVAGGRHGGRLWLAERPGAPPWLLERYADRRGLSLRPAEGGGPDRGERDGEALLQRLLGGADAQVFRAVFAFGLAELSRLESLTDQGVRDLIFSAGITGAGADARRALRVLADEAAGLWRPKAASRIGTLVAEWESARRALAEAQERVRRYPEAVAREQREGQRASAARQALQALRARERHLTRLLELWPVWLRWRSAERALAEAPDPGPFPEDGLTRLEALTEQRRQARAVVAGLQAECQVLLRQRWAVPPAVAASLEDLATEASAQRERLEEWARLEAEVRAVRQRVEEALDELAPGQREIPAAVQGTGGPAGLMDAVQAWAERLRVAGEEARALRLQATAAEEAAVRAAEDAARFGPDLPTPETWRRRLEELTTRVTAARRGQALLAAAMVLGAGAAVAWALGRWPWAGLLLAGALVCAGTGRAGWGLAAAERALVAWQARGHEVQERERAAGAAAAARAAAERARTAAAQAADALTRLEADWSRWKAERGLPPDLRPEGVQALLEGYRRLRELRDAEARAAARLQAVQAAAGAWEAKARAAAEALGEAVPPDPDGVLEWVAACSRRLAAEREAAGRAADLEARLAEAQSRLRDLDAQWWALVSAALGPDALQGGGVEAEAEEAFRRRAAAWRRHRECAAEARTAREALAAALGEGPAAEALRQALAETEGRAEEAPDGGWSAELEEVRREIARLEVEEREAIRAEAEAASARRALEEATDVPRLAAQCEEIRAELAAAVRSLRVNLAAQALLRRTLRTFLTERQPEVLRVASRVLARITDGRYVRVLQDDAEGGLCVEDTAGRRLGPDVLSRGTAEQLYLAVRLGLAASFAARAASLPLVMDDVLVNFDPARARAAAAVLAAFAAEGEGRQVLLFTCHPETVALLRSADPSCRVLTLPEAAPTPAAQEVAAAREGGPSSAAGRRPGDGMP